MKVFTRIEQATSPLKAIGRQYSKTETFLLNSKSNLYWNMRSRNIKNYAWVFTGQMNGMELKNTKAITSWDGSSFLLTRPEAI
ncbi:hypothetical protein RRG08_029586 [Elysia crispata]|uniref:Uncharacterized protein n=1 Tax=Elysia crispata TaxID=231223 RepID=A0AAE0XP61_9GAST|nr:hypothetical protein RRG08_029586 [Elysia crispata]